MSDDKPTWECCFAGDWSIRYRLYTPPHRLARYLLRVLLDIHWREIE